jgi:hypothetical protein
MNLELLFTKFSLFAHKRVISRLQKFVLTLELAVAMDAL